MKKIVGGVVALALLLGGCGSSTSPASAPSASTVSSSPVGGSQSSAESSSAVSSSVVTSATIDKAAAVKVCGDFRDALAAVPDTTGGKPTNHFLEELEHERKGGTANDIGLGIWMSSYAPPYVSAAAPDSIGKAVTAFSDRVKALTSKDSTASLHVPTAQEIKTLVEIYSDAAGQCKRAGAPLI